jgi:hypothetical protein
VASYLTVTLSAYMHVIRSRVGLLAVERILICRGIVVPICKVRATSMLVISAVRAFTQDLRRLSNLRHEGQEGYTEIHAASARALTGQPVAAPPADDTLTQTPDPSVASHRRLPDDTPGRYP